MDNGALKLHKKIKDNYPIGMEVVYRRKQFVHMDWTLGYVTAYYPISFTSLKGEYAKKLEVRDAKSGEKFLVELAQVMPPRACDRVAKKTIYIVFDIPAHDADEPSNDSIRGVFSTAGGAQAFIELIKKNESISIQENRNEYYVVEEELDPVYVKPEGQI